MAPQTNLRRIAENCRNFACATHNEAAQEVLLDMALDYEKRAMELEQLAPNLVDERRFSATVRGDI